MPKHVDYTHLWNQVIIEFVEPLQANITLSGNKEADIKAVHRFLEVKLSKRKNMILKDQLYIWPLEYKVNDNSEVIYTFSISCLDSTVYASLFQKEVKDLVSTRRGAGIFSQPACSQSATLQSQSQISTSATMMTNTIPGTSVMNIPITPTVSTKTIRKAKDSRASQPKTEYYVDITGEDDGPTEKLWKEIDIQYSTTSCRAEVRIQSNNKKALNQLKCMISQKNLKRKNSPLKGKLEFSKDVDFRLDENSQKVYYFTIECTDTNITLAEFKEEIDYLTINKKPKSVKHRRIAAEAASVTTTTAANDTAATQRDKRLRVDLNTASSTHSDLNTFSVFSHQENNTVSEFASSPVLTANDPNEIELLKFDPKIP